MTQTKKGKLADIGKGISNTAKTFGRAIVIGTTLGSMLALLLTGTTIAINSAERTLRYGFERAIEPFVERRSYDTTLVEKKEALLLGTHGRLVYGNFELEEGNRLSVYDGAYISKGKFWENSQLSGLEERTKYHLSIAGNDTLGWTLLRAEKK